MATVKGTWIFNEVIDISELLHGTDLWEEIIGDNAYFVPAASTYGISFTAKYNSANGKYFLIYNYSFGSSTPAIGDSANALSFDVRFRRITFGDEYGSIVTVSDAFYNWLVQNAIWEDDKTYTIKGLTLQSIADAIRAKTGKTNPIAVEDFDNSIAEVYDAGKQAEYDAFWDAVQESGKRTSYVYAFSRWGSEYIRPKYKVVLTAAGSQKHIFYLNKYIKKIEADYFDFSQLPRGTNDNQAFSLSFTDNSKLEEIEDIGLPISYSYELAFAWCTELTKIAKITVDANTILSNAFVNCFKLKDITFEGEIGNDINFKWSTKLTKASIESIINHLSSAVSGKTLTLSKTAVETAFEVYPADYDGDGKTDAWIGNGEEEWYELITPKSNWDIVVV